MLLPAAPARGQSPPLLFDFSRVQHKPGEVTTPDNQKVPAGTVELVDGQFGKACKFSFVAATGPQFFTAWVNPSENWDQYEGFSFWVKGDGSQSYGGLEFVDGNDYGLRFGYCFPIESTDWVKISVPWSDLVPELAAPHGRCATRLCPQPVPQRVDRQVVRLARVSRLLVHHRADGAGKAHRPRRDRLHAPEPGLPRVLAKLKARQPVTIVTMGDSLSDKRHWANREKLWSEELVKKLKTAYGSEVTLVNPAIGGTTLSQNVILMPRWLARPPRPTRDHLVRRQRLGQQRARTAVQGVPGMAVDRVRRATKGRADVLLMTTCPGFAAWETRNELCVAAYEVAASARPASSMRRPRSTRPARAKRPCGDSTGCGTTYTWVPADTSLIAETVFAAIGSGGAGDSRRQRPPPG